MGILLLSSEIFFTISLNILNIIKIMVLESLTEFANEHPIVSAGVAAGIGYGLFKIHNVILKNRELPEQPEYRKMNIGNYVFNGKLLAERIMKLKNV